MMELSKSFAKQRNCSDRRTFLGAMQSHQKPGQDIQKGQGRWRDGPGHRDLNGEQRGPPGGFQTRHKTGPTSKKMMGRLQFNIARTSR
jgi:hypothetical protein